MSPFSQLQSALGHNYGYGNGIDRDFSPILNYIDEFDRHFSRRHRFMNCFIPRFDLEEDDHNYYLYGDIPGATVNEITVEANDNHTLVIYGKTTRPGPEREVGEAAQGETKGGTEMENQAPPPPAQEQQQTFAPPPTQPAPAHTHHQRHVTSPFSTSPGRSGSIPQIAPNGHKILLAERLVGEFHRTFAFPSAVDERSVKASMENGVLSLVVPKREAAEEKKKGTKIPILKGGWWKAENGLHGENEPKGRTTAGGMDQGNAVGFGGGAV